MCKLVHIIRADDGTEATVGDVVEVTINGKQGIFRGKILFFISEKGGCDVVIEDIGCVSVPTISSLRVISGNNA